MPSLLTETRLYKIWADMKQRCSNPNCKKYHLYGGKGIRVCDEWTSFKPFEEWAYKNGYREYLTLDRINGNLNYKPSNCRWATYQQQANNTTQNHIVEIDGRCKTISEWAQEWGISYSLAQSRIYRREAKGEIFRVS